MDTLPGLRPCRDFSSFDDLLKSPNGDISMSNDEGKKDEENKTADPQKPTGKRPSGLVASPKEDRGPWLGLAQLARD